ncbi:MAG: HEPN domain-containing protein [Pseudomonadota bacterium]
MKNRWLEFAGYDLKMAELALEEGITTQVCFHAQQATEKALKAWLDHQKLKIPKTHKLADLATLEDFAFLGELFDKLAVLDSFYIPTRYPDALPGTLPEGEPSRDMAKEALETALQIVEIVEAQTSK